MDHAGIHPSQLASFAAFLDVLRAKGVTNISLHSDGAVQSIQFRDDPPLAPPAQPSTPEPSGKATPTRDIFDVLQSGVIPGAPVVDPVIPEPPR